VKFQGDHATRASYKSGIVSLEYAPRNRIEVKGMEVEFCLRVELE